MMAQVSDSGTKVQERSSRPTFHSVKSVWFFSCHSLFGGEGGTHKGTKTVVERDADTKHARE